MQSFTIKRERMTLDLLLFQAYGAGGQRLLEAALELNPGLADQGVFIPLGTSVTIPDRPDAQAIATWPIVSLFG